MNTITSTRPTHISSLIAVACAMLAMFIDPVSAQTDRDVIEVARSVLKVDRQAVLVSAMTLTGMRLAAAVPLAPVDDCK